MTAAPKSENKQTNWAGISEDESKVKGSMLLAWLYSSASEKGLSKTELAASLGVTYGYLAQLQRDPEKKMSKVGDEFIKACSDFLEIPKLAVLMASGKISPSDFHSSSHNEYKQQLENALQFIRKDYEYAAFMPGDIMYAGLEYQQAIVLFYEQATGRKLLNKKLNLEDLIDKINEQ